MPDLEDIRECNFYIVAVPTPVDRNNEPDLIFLVRASTTVGKVISKGDVVVYESAVYPGVTEDDCIPVVEKVSGLKFNMDVQNITNGNCVIYDVKGILPKNFID